MSSVPVTFVVHQALAQSPKPLTVRELAQRLAMPLPAVARAVERNLCAQTLRRVARADVRQGYAYQVAA